MSKAAKSTRARKRPATKAAAEGAYVSRAEFSAFAVAVASALSDLEEGAKRPGYQESELRYRLRERIESSSPERGAALERLLEMLDDIRERDGIRSRKRAQGRAQAVIGARGRNW